MATLTATGINCSNGTLDGYYTGTSTSNTTYPIGSYLMGNLSLGGVNSSQNVYINGGAVSATPGTICAGTWRTRGYGPATIVPCQGNFYAILVQRTA